MNIKYFLDLVDTETQNKVLPIIKYINDKYKEAELSDSYSPKVKIPTWNFNNSFVAIGCRKHYITIYFKNRDAVTYITENYPFCRGLKTCVNFSYFRELPKEIICTAIDINFSK